MRKLVFFIALLVHTAVCAQTKYFSKEVHIGFSSQTPVETFDAHNYKATTVIVPATGAIEMAVLISGFDFKKALMQEHFNENYMESAKYPKATFKGTVTNIQSVNFTKDGTYAVEVKGQLTMHGVTKDIVAKGTITVEKGAVKMKSGFSVKPEDYNIAIPGVVKEKIAKEIAIVIEGTLQQMSK